MLGFERIALMPIRLSPASLATHWSKKSSGLANVSASFSLSQASMNVASLALISFAPSHDVQSGLLVLPQNPRKIDRAADAVFGQELVVVVAGERAQPGDLKLAVRHSRVVVRDRPERLPSDRSPDC